MEFRRGHPVERSKGASYHGATQDIILGYSGEPAYKDSGTPYFSLGQLLVRATPHDSQLGVSIFLLLALVCSSPHFAPLIDKAVLPFNRINDLET